MRSSLPVHLSCSLVAGLSLASHCQGYGAWLLTQQVPHKLCEWDCLLVPKEIHQ